MRRLVDETLPLAIGTAGQARALAVVEVTLLTGVTRHRRLCTFACHLVTGTDRTFVRRSTDDGVGLTAVRGRITRLALTQTRIAIRVAQATVRNLSTLAITGRRAGVRT